MSNPDTPQYWHFDFGTAAFKQLQRVPKKHRDNIVERLKSIVRTKNPRAGDPRYLKTLTGNRYKGVLKYRVGNYRILLEIDRTPVTVRDRNYRGTIIVIAVDHRKDIYRP